MQEMEVIDDSTKGGLIQYFLTFYHESLHAEGGIFQGRGSKVVNFGILYQGTQMLRLEMIMVRDSEVSWQPLLVELSISGFVVNYTCRVGMMINP